MTINVQVFGRAIDPREYARGNGLAGWVIGVVNRLRLRLERWLALRILVVEGRRAGLTRRACRRLARLAARDPLVRPWLDVPPRPAPKALPRDPDAPEPVQSRDERYQAGRRNSHGLKPVETADPFAFTLSVAQQHVDRASRYYRGRHHLTITEVES